MSRVHRFPVDPLAEGRGVLLVARASGARSRLGEELRGHGLTIATASTGTEALDLLEAGRWRLVLIDHALDDGGGLDFVRHVQLANTLVQESGPPLALVNREGLAPSRLSALGVTAVFSDWPSAGDTLRLIHGQGAPASGSKPDATH